MTAVELEAYLHEQIPLSRSMGVRVELTHRGLELVAPLEPNHNHLGTAFGGSLAVVATLAGYAWLWRELDDAEAHLVIRKSQVDYRLPVGGELRARCHAPDRMVLERFEAQFRRAGKARIELQVTMEDAGKVAVDFRGDFVAIR
ncbi:thioesterase domain-containing protein [Haloferula luteola]|uniref:Thioesterase domain-containing protein n=1 Tax=Haloferula luteola TaxID=595692 RepID=A0A840V7V8_9BACT|nr:YiiD C-terminal domain-containing protein [Haloferula luteola]MBB5351674.1 thioesterase domain-containing protein [Haloferula luteola]